MNNYAACRKAFTNAHYVEIFKNGLYIISKLA